MPTRAVYRKWFKGGGRDPCPIRWKVLSTKMAPTSPRSNVCLEPQGQRLRRTSPERCLVVMTLAAGRSSAATPTTTVHLHRPQVRRRHGPTGPPQAQWIWLLISSIWLPVLLLHQEINKLWRSIEHYRWHELAPEVSGQVLHFPTFRFLSQALQSLGSLACAVLASCCTPRDVCLWRSQSVLRCKPKGGSLESSKSALFVPRFAGALEADAAPRMASAFGAFLRKYFPNSLCLMAETALQEASWCLLLQTSAKWLQ